MKNLLFFTLLFFALHTSAQEAYNKGDVFIDVQTGASFIGGIIGYCFWQRNTPDSYSSGGCETSSSPTPEKFRREHPNNLALWNIHLGFRYFIFKNVGLNGEVAFGNALSFKVGVSVKI